MQGKLILALAVVTVCVQTAFTSPCNCGKIFLQVCGSDGVTYDNICLMTCAGASKVSDGPCPPIVVKRDVTDSPCVCPSNYLPECGVDGVTYQNKCLRECAGVLVAKSGACDGGNPQTLVKREVTDSPCGCQLNYLPECGVDGVTYDNKCLRECAGVLRAKSGACGGENPQTLG